MVTFKKWLERAAAKASCVNVGYDIERLVHSFPANVPASSKALYTLTENLSYAFANGASDDDVLAVVGNKSRGCSAELAYILHLMVHLARAAHDKDFGIVNEIEARVDEVFKQATGSLPDITQAPASAIAALKARAAGRTGG